ncbi:MAG TPA: hypothetical protein VMR52_12880 [Dehalococcoidia bacterium]|nr:hypothetical protein [Dehalococcoidia bacterium]
MFPDLSYKSIYGAFLAVPLDEIVDAFRLLIQANEAFTSEINGAGILQELMQDLPERSQPVYEAPSQLFAS